MYIALDENGHRISIENAATTNNYFCPVCNEKVRVKAVNSQYKKAHFAHQRGTECLDNWHHDMSEWHLQWQQKFPEECREVVVEKDGIKHRADVLIEESHTVIEFQHSPIKGEEILARNAFYHQCGYKIVWVFDAKSDLKDHTLRGNPPAILGGEWKRRKSSFDIVIPKEQNVTLFLQCEFTINQNEKCHILLQLVAPDPKYLSFVKTYGLVTQSHFLREYANVGENSIPSIQDIIQATKKIDREQQRIKEAKKTQQLTAFLNRTPRRQRRW